jgi:large subunit ribosomal protein L18e
MAKRTGPSNVYLRSLVESLRKKSFDSKTPIWRDVAEKLNRPRRSRVEVNLIEIERNTKEGDTVIIPGVVLSNGDLTKSVNIAAWKFSSTAQDKIKKSGGKIMSIDELEKENPKGSGVKILV